MKGLMVQIPIIISLDGNQKKVKEKRNDVEGQRSIGEGFCPRRLQFAREAERTVYARKEKVSQKDTERKKNQYIWNRSHSSKSLACRETYLRLNRSLTS